MMMLEMGDTSEVDLILMGDIREMKLALVVLLTKPLPNRDKEERRNEKNGEDT